jgi:DNA repair ATPase RecN
MKPKPLASLNHFTVPVAITYFLKKLRAQTQNMFEIQDRKRPSRHCRKLETKHSRLFTSYMTASQALSHTRQKSLRALEKFLISVTIDYIK